MPQPRYKQLLSEKTQDFKEALWDWLTGQLETPPRYSPWFPGDFSPFMQVNNDRALATGLTFRPIEETARDMIALLDGGGIDTERGELSLEKEAELVSLWRTRES